MRKANAPNQMVQLVQEALGKKAASIWWQTPHPGLGGVPPLWMTRPAMRKELYRVIKTTLVQSRHFVDRGDASNDASLS